MLYGLDNVLGIKGCQIVLIKNLNDEPTEGLIQRQPENQSEKVMLVHSEGISLQQLKMVLSSVYVLLSMTANVWACS